MIFQKQSEYSENKPYSNIKIDLIDPDNIYDTYIKPLQEEKAKFKSKLYFENKNVDSSFAYKVNKYLYSIKVNPKINNKYGKAYSYYEQFLTQKQPEDMKYEEWEKVKITENKVLSYLKRIVKSQNNVEVDKIQLVKTDYTLKLKAYSNKTKIQLSKLIRHIYKKPHSKYLLRGLIIIYGI
jgi:hypothetical protein